MVARPCEEQDRKSTNMTHLLSLILCIATLFYAVENETIRPDIATVKCNGDKETLCVEYDRRGRSALQPPKHVGSEDSSIFGNLEHNLAYLTDGNCTEMVFRLR